MTSSRHASILSLFTGAGGLDVGLETAGFENRLCVEVDPHARATLTRNRPSWQLATPGDIHLHSAAELIGQAGLRARQLDLLAGGPPCQPFSKSGYWSAGDSKRLKDPRAKTLEAYLDVLESALPRAFLLENVPGLAFDSKDEGLQMLRARVEEINKRKGVSYT